MNRAALLMAASACLVAGCDGAAKTSAEDAPANEAVPAIAEEPAGAEVSLTRLDCGTATIKNFDSFFSDKKGLYEQAPREITDSCYLVRHGDQAMIWDTGFAAELKGKEQDMGQLVARMDKTIPEQLAEVGLKPEDIDVVGISHMHADHTGQAKLFPKARLVVGRGDFDQSAGAEDPFGPWRTGQGGSTTFIVKDGADIFGDGKVMAVHLPGHTPDHMGLLVNLASGPVLLSGDLYHSHDARQKRGVPPFNTDRAQTIASMDKFEALAKERGANVIIQHEPRDIAKLPAFPQAAQ